MYITTTITPRKYKEYFFFAFMHNMVVPRNHLFESTKNGGGFDLVAMNIQRGRQMDSILDPHSFSTLSSIPISKIANVIHFNVIYVLHYT